MGTPIFNLANELVYDIIDRLGDDIVSICNLSQTCKQFQIVADKVLARKCRAFRVGNQTNFYREHQPLPTELSSYEDIDQVCLGYICPDSRNARKETESLLLYLLALCKYRKLTRFPVLAAINYTIPPTIPRQVQQLPQSESHQVALIDNERNDIATVLNKLWTVRLRKLDDVTTNSLFFEVQFRQPLPIISAILALLPNLKVVNFLNEQALARGTWNLSTAPMTLGWQPCFASLETMYLNCLQPSTVEREELRSRSDAENLRDVLCLPSLKVLKAQYIHNVAVSTLAFDRVIESPITTLELEHCDVIATCLGAIFSKTPHLRRFVYRHEKATLNPDFLGFDLRALNTALDHVADTLQELYLDFKTGPKLSQLFDSSPMVVDLRTVGHAMANAMTNAAASAIAGNSTGSEYSRSFFPLSCVPIIQLPHSI